MTTEQPDIRRISKREFISRVSARSGQPLRVVSSVYESIILELLSAVTKGEAVVLTGFGRFYRQDHKGHKVRFGKEDVDDYSVLKFSASRSMNRNLGDEAVEEEDWFGVPAAAASYVEEIEALDPVPA